VVSGRTPSARITKSAGKDLPDRVETVITPIGAADEIVNRTRTRRDAVSDRVEIGALTPPRGPIERSAPRRVA
jgi:hypothetical protein